MKMKFQVNNSTILKVIIIIDYIVNVRGSNIIADGIPPKILSRGQTFKVVNGASVLLPCEIQNLGTFVVVWKKGASLLSAGQQKITRDSRISLSGYNLEIRDIRASDQGDYTCQLGDGVDGDLIHTIEILVAPSIQIFPQNGKVIAKKGGTVSFECKANGNPGPVIQWSKRDGLLPSGLQVQIGYLLNLNDVRKQDAGFYQCTASNGIGQPVTAEIHLHVLYSPEVSVLRSWVNSGEGLEAKLDCIVHADPPAEVMWYQDSFLLQPTDRRLMSNDGKTYTLTIKNVQVADFGNYSCLVSNSLGRDKKYMELSGKPGPPRIISHQYSNSHEYELKWVVPSVFPILEVRILYRKLMTNVSYHLPGQWHDLLVNPAQSYNAATCERTQSYLINHLDADSVYEVLVQTKNQHGFGETSDLYQWFTSRKGTTYDASSAFRNAVAYQLILVLFILLVCSLKLFA